MKITSCRLWFLAAGIVVGAVVYLWASSPDKVEVKPDGSVIGVQNHIREALQGKHFWVNQRSLAYKELARERTQPDRDRALQSELDNISRESRQSMEQFYRENPSARPSQAATQAEALRELADKVEQTELDQILNEFRLNRVTELEQILAITDLKAR